MNSNSKYRVWDISDKKYYDDSHCICLVFTGDIYERTLGGFLKVKNKYKIEFASGLKDTNNRDIYDGDIIRGSRNFTYQVYFDKKQATFMALCQENQFEYSLDYCLRLLNKNQNMHVIGNINENTEIIKVLRVSINKQIEESVNLKKHSGDK